MTAKTMHMSRKHTSLQEIKLSRQKKMTTMTFKQISFTYTAKHFNERDDNAPLIIKMMKLFLGCDLGKPEDREMT